MPGRQEDAILFRSEEDLLLQDLAECEAWTWTNEESEVFPFHCIMFSSIGETSSYPNCVRNVINTLHTKIFLSVVVVIKQEATIPVIPLFTFL